jgi:ubiquinone biosynthesis protein
MIPGTSIGKRVRHLGRYREIAQILVANGFGWFIAEIGLSELLDYPRRWFRKAEPERVTLSTYERVRHVMEQLGPTFVKLGQLASVRRDMFPAGLIDELSRLQDDVAPISIQQVRAAIETEFAMPIDDVFLELDETPVGAASIGQVHRGVLVTGEEVAIKVQRPDISRQIHIDLEILMDLAHMAERHFDWARHYVISDVVEEFRTTILRELDYQIEGRNADKLRDIHEKDDNIRVPLVHWDLTTQKVLVMEYVEGIKFANRDLLVEMGYDCRDVAEQTVSAILTELLLHGFFHADPHPGNLAVLPDGGLVLMDFGMVGKLSPEMKGHLASLVVALMRRDSEAILRTLYRMGIVPADVDNLKLRHDVEGLRSKYYDVSFHEISLAQATSDLFTVAYKHQIKIPSELTLVGKTLMTLEGVLEHLAPDFRILDIAEPFGRRLLRERLNPKNVTRDTVRGAFDVFDILMDVPRQVRSLFQGLQRGRVKVELDFGEFDRIVRQMTRISNRWTLSIMLLSLSIFLAGLMIASSLAKSPSQLWSFPFNDVVLAVGVILGGLVMWSIFRSGKS